jgi:hypothetical protein
MANDSRGATGLTWTASCVLPDGQRFVSNALPAGAPTPLVLVTNWVGDLKK